MAQVWLVTGSSRGLGHAIVEAGLVAGNKVLATARDIKSLADLSERYGDQVKLFAMDVTDEAAAANAVMAAVDVFGSLDVVINNAGPSTFLFAADVCVLVPLNAGFAALPVRHIFYEFCVRGWLLYRVHCLLQSRQPPPCFADLRNARPADDASALVHRQTLGL